MAWKRLSTRQLPAGAEDLTPNECERCGAVVMSEDGKRKHEAWHAQHG